MSALIRLFPVLGLLLVLFHPSGAAAQNAERIAVLQFGGSLPDGVMMALTDEARNGALSVVRGLNYTVMTRENTYTLLVAQGLNPEACVAEANCEVEFGQNIGAALVMSGLVVEVEGNLNLTMKVFDTDHGGNFLGSVRVKAQGAQDLMDAVSGSAAELLADAMGVDIAPRGGALPRGVFSRETPGFSAGDLGVESLLQEQNCQREAEVQARERVAARLDAEVMRLRAEVDAAWAELRPQVTTCAALEDPGKRQHCASTVMEFAAWAAELQVDLTAGVEQVETDCGSRGIAFARETRDVEVDDLVSALQQAMEELEQGPEDLEEVRRDRLRTVYETRFSSAAVRRAFARKRSAMVRDQLVGNGVTNQALLGAMASIPMEMFVPSVVASEIIRQRDGSSAQLIDMIYTDGAVPIGFEESISQPFMTAFTIEAMAINVGDRVLELKTASGYQAALLAEMGAEVWTVETDSVLYEHVNPVLLAFGYPNLHYTVGDVRRGWTGRTYDAIVATAAYRQVPRAILRLLAPGGRFLVPIGTAGGSQALILYEKDMGGTITHRELMPVMFSMMPGE